MFENLHSDLSIRFSDTACQNKSKREKIIKLKIKVSNVINIQVFTEIKRFIIIRLFDDAEICTKIFVKIDLSGFELPRAKKCTH